ncbi:MAG: immunoglobulin-like domain-containing protein, partial [Sarcina sp.]
MKIQKTLALFVSITLLITSITTVSFAKNNDLNFSKAVLNKSISSENLKNTIIQVNDLSNNMYSTSSFFNTLEDGIFKIGFDEENKKLKLFNIRNTYFFTGTIDESYFVLKVLDPSWRIKKEITFKGSDITGWGKENEINNFQYDYGDILSLWSIIPEAMYIHGKILGLQEDYPYIMPGSSTSYNFQITKDGLKAVHTPSNLDENLSSNIIEIRSKFWDLSKYLKWLSRSIDAFKIIFDENTKQLKVIKRKNFYYLNKDIQYGKYFQIKIFNKDLQEKINIELNGYDMGTSPKLDQLNNFKYEYGDIIKLWCQNPINQKISGKILQATADYSKGMKYIENLEELYFQVTPKGLKEIRSDSPKILGVDDVILRKGNSFNKIENVSALDYFDRNITKNLKVTGNVNINKIGTYNLKYKVSDSSNNTTEITRKVTVIEEPKLEKNKISILDLRNVENFKIKFDDFKKEFKIETLKNSQLNSNFNNKNYFTFNLLDKNFKEKLNLSLNGNDSSTSSKLDGLKNFKYEYGDIIKLEHVEPSKLRISGEVINGKEDYSDGINNIDNINNVYFEVTNEGLKSLYNNAPIIKGVKNKTIRVGDTFNSLDGITVEDDLDKDLTVSVTGTVNTNKAGVYNLIYTSKDKLGRTSTQKSTITVKELTPLEKNKLIVEGYSNRELLNIGFNIDRKNLTLNRLNTSSYFNESFNEFFKIKIKDRSNIEKLAITINGKDFSSTSKLNPLEGFNFEYGDIIDIWHASTTGINGSLKINGTVLNSKENYVYGLSLDAMNNTKFEITENGLKAIFNEGAIFRGIDDIIINVNDSFDPLQGVYVSDNLHNNLVAEVKGVVDNTTAGIYTLTYSV